MATPKKSMESVQKRTVLIREHSIFYGLLPISVNQDQVVRALPANCCARHVPYFYGAFSGMTSIQSGSLGLGASGTGHVFLAVDRTHRAMALSCVDRRWKLKG
jgi:hypothetical protein